MMPLVVFKKRKKNSLYRYEWFRVSEAQMGHRWFQKTTKAKSCERCSPLSLGLENLGLYLLTRANSQGQKNLGSFPSWGLGAWFLGVSKIWARKQACGIPADESFRVKYY